MHTPHARLPNRHAFTLIEMLVVLVVAGVLLALLQPAINGRTRMAHGSKAKSVARAIVNAVRNYEVDYAGMPLVAEPRNKAERFIFVGDSKAGATTSNASLFDVLRAIPRGVNHDDVLNPRRQKYFEESKAMLGTARNGFADGKEFPAEIQGQLLDNWGSQYCVVMDVSKENSLNLSSVYRDLIEPIRHSIVAFSLGTDCQLGSQADRGRLMPRDRRTLPDDMTSFE